MLEYRRDYSAATEQNTNPTLALYAPTPVVSQRKIATKLLPFYSWPDNSIDSHPQVWYCLLLSPRVSAGNPREIPKGTAI